jgi:site-specific DNA-adenine methylase
LENYIIYCDPPYSKQAHYYTESGEHVTPFDHEEFWEWCREMSKNNLVFVSEYKAPDDFDLVWSTKSKTTRRSMTEKLYVIKYIYNIVSYYKHDELSWWKTTHWTKTGTSHL